jgi:hypothetical protein
LDSGFYYTSLSSGIALAAGQDYYIGALNGRGDSEWGGVTSTTTASEVTFLTGAYTYGSELTVPVDSTFDPLGYFGPNFQFSAVPEPSTYVAGALMLVPLGASAFRQLRKKSQAV